VTITHDMNIAHRCHRIIRIMDGLIESQKHNGNGRNKNLIQN